jgi:hypothetical protein
MGRRPALALAALLALTFGQGRAYANDVANAEAAFEDGRRLLAAGQLPWACAKFEESQRLDPATGTLLNLAACHQSLGRLATAWSEFRAAEAAAARDKRADRVAFAHQHALALEPRLAHLQLTLPAEMRLPGLKLLLDGIELTALPTLDVPLDPGPHQIQALAPGYEPFAHTVQANNEGERFSVTVTFPAKGPKGDVAIATPLPSSGATVAPPALRDPVAPPRQASSPAPQGSGLLASVPTSISEPAQPPSDDERPRSLGRAHPELTLAVAGAGAALVAAGAFFGVRAFQQWSDRNAGCNGDPNDCQSRRQSAHDAALTSARLADVMVPLGLVGLGAGAYLWWGRAW